MHRIAARDPLSRSVFMGSRHEAGHDDPDFSSGGRAAADAFEVADEAGESAQAALSSPRPALEEDGLELVAGAADAAFHRADRAAHDGGDLFVLHAAGADQDQRLAL